MDSVKETDVVQWICIGTELLDGTTIDAHTQSLSYILNKHIVTKLQKLKITRREYLFVCKTFGMSESAMNERLKKMKLPSNVTIGYRTHWPENHVRLQIQATNFEAAKRQFKKLLGEITKRLGPDLFLWGESSFSEEVFERLLKQRAVIAIAESCTGGLISALLTEVSGSSKVLDRGFVTYGNQAKIDLLGVKRETLERYGAVSKETAREMAVGALRHSEANRTVAVTGIAGPTGGTKAKPVGTIWIVGARGKRLTEKCLSLPFDRCLNQRFAAYEALRMLVEI